MNSRVSWSVEGIDPSVRERAEAAARRAGMSLSDWLNSTIGESAPPNFRAPRSAADAPSQETRDVADIHQRLDSITRQIEQISRPAPRQDSTASASRNDAPATSAARRARRRPAIERRHLAPRRAAVADLKPGACKASPASGRAAPGRHGRARGRPGLSPLAAAQPGVARLRDRGNRCAPERT